MVCVSVIIPIYCVEAYLARCVDSVIKQTMRDIEIILVDDGSPDHCPQLCDAYAEKDSRIVVVHKKNGGLASARNAGMKAATGDYLFFLDSDDWIEPQTLEELLCVAGETDVDFVRFRPMYANWPGKEDGALCDFGTEEGMSEGIYNRERIVQEIYPRLIGTPKMILGPIVSAWRSLYRRAFLTANEIWFDEEVRYSEDTIFSAKVVRASNSFFYLDGPRYYHYFFNPSSITKSFRADRWDSCKKLIACFEREFGCSKDYDFTNQLWLQKMYCVLSALGQRTAIRDLRQREKYCQLICSDAITKEAFRHLNLVQVPWKLRIQMEWIRLGWIKLLARF